MQWPAGTPRCNWAQYLAFCLAFDGSPFHLIPDAVSDYQERSTMALIKSGYGPHNFTVPSKWDFAASARLVCIAPFDRASTTPSPLAVHLSTLSCTRTCLFSSSCVNSPLACISPDLYGRSPVFSAFLYWLRVNHSCLMSAKAYTYLYDVGVHKWVIFFLFFLVKWIAFDIVYFSTIGAGSFI